MLKVNSLSFKYSTKNFSLQDISLEAEPGYIYTIIGENGSGKTTLLKLIYGMLTPKSGEVIWNDKRITSKTLSKYHQEVAYVGTEWCVGAYSIIQNKDMFSVLYPNFDEEYFEELIKKSDLEEVKDKAYDTLSRGQKVKAEIAFNMAKKPKFLILDEPLANLDPIFKVDILELIQRAVADDGMGVMMSTNLLDEIKNITDYAGIMKDGRMEKWGTNEDILQ